MKRVLIAALVFFGMLSTWAAGTFAISLSIMWGTLLVLGVPISFGHDLPIVIAMVEGSLPAGVILCAGFMAFRRYGFGLLTLPLPGSTK